MSTGPKPSRPSLVAPLSRHLAVASLDQSLAFYRDVLDFAEQPGKPRDELTRGTEVVRGPARILLTVADEAADSTGERRPRGSAILFFETNDVTGMRAAVVSQGGSPSQIERANWIKMRMFQVQDPDGHTLWFGQSFQEPELPRPEPMLQKIMPNFPLSDVPRGVAYYQEVLGFSINYAQDDLGVMERDEATIVLVARNGTGGIGSCYVYVKDADALHAELIARGAKVQGEPVSHPWGLRDFRVLDLEENQISFGQPFE